MRILLASTSALAEVLLYRSVYEKINKRVGRYLFFMLIFNSGMWNASAGSCFFSVGENLLIYLLSVASVVICDVRSNLCVCCHSATI